MRPLLLAAPLFGGLLLLGLLLRAVELALCIILVATLLGIVLTRDRAIRNTAGRRGEEQAARVLVRIPDADIFHDVYIGHENADSVVLTQQGVYSIEVKNYAQAQVNRRGVQHKGREKNAVISQARRQAAKLAKTLKVRVTPVLVFTHVTARVSVSELEGVHLCSLSRLPHTITRLRRQSQVSLSGRQYEVALQILEELTHN